MFHPTAVVFSDKIGTRRVKQPWIHSKTATSAFSHPADAAPGPGGATPYTAATELGIELLLQGSQRLSQRSWPGWEHRIHELEERGYHQMAAKLRQTQAIAGNALNLVKMLRLSSETR